MQQMQFAIILAFISICQVLIVTPDPMPAPTVDSINAKSFVVQFKPVVGATKYYVTVAPRHVGTIPAPLETSGLTVTVQNLTEFKIYYVSVQDGNGQVGNTAEIRTLPRVSNIHLGAPLPHAVDVFFNMKYSAAITGWRMQYEKTNSENVTPMEVDANTTYSFRVTDLAPDTPYRIRARPLQLYGTTQILESEELYSSWTSFTTDSLSIFGRVVLTNVTYTANHKTPYGPEWNSSQEIIEQGYSSINNNGISLIRIEESDGGKAQIHYRVKVKDKSLPSPTDFSLNGTDFTDSFINNGDVALGKTYIYKAGDAWTLIYSPDEGSTCDKLVERYMIVTPQDDATFEIHLNVASSDATTAYEDDALRVKSDGRLVTDDAETARTVSLNTVLVLSPRFLIKDCLTKVATPLYTEYFEATNADTSVPFTNTYESTGTIASIFNRTAVTHTFCIDGTCVTLSIPAVAKAIKYEVFTSESIDAVSTLEERDIDGSDFLKVLVDSLVNGTTYIFTLKITTRGLDDRTSSFMTNSFNVTPIAAMVTTTPNPTTTDESTTVASESTSATEAITSTAATTTMISEASTKSISSTVASTAATTATTSEASTKSIISTVASTAATTATTSEASTKSITSTVASTAATTATTSEASTKSITSTVASTAATTATTSEASTKSITSTVASTAATTALSGEASTVASETTSATNAVLSTVAATTALETTLETALETTSDLATTTEVSTPASSTGSPAKTVPSTASPPVTASSSTSMTTLRTTPTTPIRTSRTTTTSASGKQQNSRSYSRGWSSCVGAYPAHCSRCYSSWSNRCCRHLPCCTHLKALCCLNQENRGNNVYYRPCNYFSFCVNSHYQAKESQPERKSRYQERGSTRYSHHGRKLQTRYSLYKHSSPSFAETFYSTKTPTYTYSQSERRSRYQARGSPTYHHPRIYDTRDRYSLYKPSSSSTMQINYQMKSPRYTHTYSRYVRQPTYGNRHGYANQQYVHHTRSHYLLYRKNSSPLGIS